MRVRSFLIFIIGIFIINSVVAFGVSPARTMIDFEKNLEKTVGFDVLNSGGEDIKVLISADGDLAEYISLPEREAVILGSEKSRRFVYKLHLPDSFEPGLHTGEIFVLKVPSANISDDSQILASLAVVTQVYVYVPYPGKYANAKLYVREADSGKGVRFVIPVASAGEFDLVGVKANIDIYSKVGEKIDNVNVGSIDVPSGKQKELVYDWDMEVPAGEYVAKVLVFYGEGSVSLEESFRIGEAELKLEDIWADEFRLGEVVKLEMLVENKWSEAIGNVFVKTKISNDRGRTVSEFQSSDYSLDGASKEVFVSYWDTAGVLEGDYDAEIAIKYGDRSSKENLRFEVSKDKLVVVGLGYVVSNSVESKDHTLLIVIVLLVLMNLVWFVLLRKKLRGKRR